MRVLLLEPPKVPWEMMGDVVAPPVGLAQLAGCLERAQIPVQILDANALGIGWKKLPAAIAEAAPDLIGMTVYTPYVPEVSRAVVVAREAAPRAVIALGGPHVTFAVEETLATMPGVDVVARGEGDQIIVDLARAAAEGGLEGVPGISFRRDGRIVENPPAPLVDMKQLPLPAYHLLPMDRYHWRGLGGSFSTLVTSRGCPFKCTFCSEWPFWGGRWRAYDPRAVVEQLDLLVNRYGRRNIWFGDDCFNVDRDHVAAICEGILERGIQMSWFYQGRADMLVKHKDLLPLMRRAGNRMAQIGIEASNDEQRDGLNKQLSTDTVKEAVRLLREHGMVCQGMMIVGLPDDSPSTFAQKVRLVKELDIDFPVFVFYTLFPGTPMYREAVEKGLLEIPADYARHDMAHVLLPTKYMTRQQIYSYTGWALTRVYLHPVRLAKYLRSRNDLQRHLRGEMVSYVLKQAARSMMPGF